MKFILMCLFVAVASAATIDSVENKQSKRAVYGVGYGARFGVPHAPVIATHAPIISHAAPLSNSIPYGSFGNGLRYPYGGLGYPFGGLGYPLSSYYFGSPSIF